MQNTSARPVARRVLDAYRETHAHNPVALESDDGDWLRVGSLLEHASLVPEPDKASILQAVQREVFAVLGTQRWNAGHCTDPAPPRNECTLEGRMRVYCECIEDAGAPEVADAILAALLTADSALSSLERARIEAVRARLAWKRGDLDVASERYRRVAASARRERSDELRVRHLIGAAIVARHRGNYPQSRQLGERAAALADKAQLTRLASIAHQTLMVAAAVRGDFDAAIEHGWQAYTRANGEGSLEVAALGNMGQLFLDAGHPETAAAAFSIVIRLQPADRVLLPALGGLAVATARLGRAAELEAVTQELLARADVIARSATYDLATVMLDLSLSHHILGNAPRAAVFRRRASRLAEQYGYHEIAIRSEQPRPIPAPAPLQRDLPVRVEAVAGRVRHLAGV